MNAAAARTILLVFGVFALIASFTYFFIASEQSAQESAISDLQTQRFGYPFNLDTLENTSMHEYYAGEVIAVQDSGNLQEAERLPGESLPHRNTYTLRTVNGSHTEVSIPLSQPYEAPEVAIRECSQVDCPDFREFIFASEAEKVSLALEGGEIQGIRRGTLSDITPGRTIHIIKNQQLGEIASYWVFIDK